jgi:hypothetical protein
MSTDAPERTDIRLVPTWPPVKVVEREESRREHAIMAGLMAVTTAALALAPASVGVYIGLFTAFVAGLAWQNWLSYPYVHGDGGDGR